MTFNTFQITIRNFLKPPFQEISKFPLEPKRGNHPHLSLTIHHHLEEFHIEQKIHDYNNLGL